MAVKRAVFEVDVKGSEKLAAAYKAMRAFQQGVKSTGSSMAAWPFRAVRSYLADFESRMARLDERSRKIASAWRSVSEHTRSVAGNLYSGLNTLLRWTGVGGLAGGLVTGGSIWGLERMASSAGAARRSSSGLGLGYGQQSAFGLAYNRLIDAQGFLGGVSTARGNVASGAAGSLYTLGMDPTRGGNTGDVANEALDRIRALAKTTPEGELGFLLQSNRLSELGLGTEDLRRLKNTPDSEYGEFKDAFARRTKQLEVEDRVLKRWQDLDVQLDAAAQKIKNAFIVGLEALATPLSNLSEGLGNAVIALSGSKGFKTILEKLATGLNTFAEYVGSEKFKDDVKLFVNSIEMLARKTVAALRWIGVVPDPNDPNAGKSRDEVRREKRAEEGSKVMDFIKKFNDFVRPYDPMSKSIPATQSYGNFWGTQIQTGLGNSNLTRDQLLHVVGQIESGNNPRAPRGKSGEYGQYQIMPGTGKQYGFTEQDLMDPDKNKAAAMSILADLSKRYNGNIQDILVGYNAGPGAADDWIKKGRDMRHLNPTTREYLTRASVIVNVNNNTGGSAVTTVGTLGAVVPR